MKVPFAEVDEREMWTPLQARALEQQGIIIDGSQIRKPTDDHPPSKLCFDKNSGLMRSNFKLVDKWDQLRDINNVIEIPYKFGASFPYPVLIKVIYRAFSIIVH